MNRMALFAGFWREAETTWDFSRFAIAAADPELLDARESYQVYVFLRTCLPTARTEAALRQLEAQVQRARARTSDDRQRRLDARLAEARAGYARCAGLPEEVEPLTLEWLTRAALRGYPLAQIAYYRSFRWLASRRPYLLFETSDRVSTYRRLAPVLLAAALRSGHGEAFVEMARALSDGLVFDENRDEARAYLLAAKLAGLPEDRWVAELDGDLMSGTTSEQVREARERAESLCDRYCW